MKNSQLLSGGEHYDLLVNWDKRKLNEFPFLKDLLCDKPKELNILEVGCSTGHHAKWINNLGFSVTGIDPDPSMIKLASSRCPNCTFFTEDFMGNFKFSFSADIVISLGNVFGLIAASSGYEELIFTTTQYFKSKGTLIFQTLNTKKKREGWSKPRTIQSDKGETIFLRGFKTTKEFLHPQILTLFKPKNSSEWILQSATETNIPRISDREMTNLLEKNGYINIEMYGDYQKNKYDPDSSIDLIIVAEYNKD